MGEGTEVREKPHSIELSRTSKGDYSWKIKLYFEDVLRDANLILDQIDQINNTLLTRYRSS